MSRLGVSGLRIDQQRLDAVARMTALWPQVASTDGATGGVGGARVQRASLSGSAGYRFAGPGAPQAQADRINVLLRLKHGSVVGVEPPEP